MTDWAGAREKRRSTSQDLDGDLRAGVRHARPRA